MTINHNVFEISEIGANVLAAGDAWRKYTIDNNIENPLNKRLSLMDKYSKKNNDGSWSLLSESQYSLEDQEKMKQWQQDKYAYMRARDRFEIEWIAERAGWNVAYTVAINWNNDWNDLVWYFTEFHIPCEYDGCNMFCKNFENCIKDGFKDGID